MLSSKNPDSKHKSNIKILYIILKDNFAEFACTITLFFIILFAYLLSGCVNDPEPAPVCTQEVVDVCFVSDYDGEQTCGYPSMDVCLERFSVFGGTCFEKLTEVCE